MKMPTNVKIFKKRWAERGDPNRLLLVVKLERPTFSWGIRKKIITIKKRLIKIPNIFSISLFYLRKFVFMILLFQRLH